MRIQQIQPQKFNTTRLLKGISNPISEVPVNMPKAKGFWASTIATISGIYLANKSLKENPSESLKNLGFNDETVNKILNKTNQKGKKVFNPKALNILLKVAQLEDKTFYSYIMKNLDNIEYLTKKCDFSTRRKTYRAYVKNGENETFADMFLVYDGLKIKFKNILKNAQTTREYTKREDVIIDDIYDENKNNTKIVYNKDKNLITRSEIKDNETKLIKKQTQFSPNGVIKATTLKDVSYYVDNNSVKKYNLKIQKYDAEKDVKIFAQGQATHEGLSTFTKVYKNPITNKTETILMKLSDVPGVYNSVIINENGSKKVESFAKKNPDGSILVKKNYVSLDGTLTNYTYTSSKNESKMHYQILSDRGEVLSTIDKSFKRLTPNLAKSSINGHEYIIVKKSDKYIISDNLGNKWKIPFIKLGYDAQNHLDFFDKMSGDMLVDMYRKDVYYTHLDNVLKSSMNPTIGELKSGEDLFIFSHEQGHSKDFDVRGQDFYKKVRAKISTHPTFVKTYEQERSNFISAFPGFERTHIDYFIDKKNHFSGPTGAKEETVAEINALLSLATGNDYIATRGYYLQKFFPKTISMAAKFLNPNSNLYVGK